MQNKIISMARELLEIDSDIPYRFNYTDYPDEKPTVDDFEIHIFEQTWGSTALGFSGIGGQAMTTANTYVFIPLFVHQNCFVYFGAKFAYAVPYSEVFVKDVGQQKMEPVFRKGKYLKLQGD